MQARILHIQYSSELNVLYAGGFDGVLYKLDEQLNVQMSSTILPKIGGLYVIAVGPKFVYGRDFGNNLVQWCKETLRVLRIFNLENVTSEKYRGTEYSPIPTVTHGLHFLHGKLFVNNAFGELLELDPNHLSLNKIWNVPSQAFIESIAVSNRDSNEAVISDCTGHIMHGHLFCDSNTPSTENNLKTLFRLDSAPIHKIAYDKRFNRYWMTTDGHGGFSIVEPFSQKIHRVYLTNDCTEWVELSADGSLAAVACFDHHLYIFENGLEPRLKEKIGPFKFQLKQVAIKENECAFVLLESGEIYRVSLSNAKIEKTVFGSDCIWDMKLCPPDLNKRAGQNPSAQSTSSETRKYFCTTESGFISQVSIQFAQENICLEEVRRSTPFEFGRIRRVIPLSSSDFVACATAKTVFRANMNGRIAWQFEGDGIPREIAHQPQSGSCFAVFESGLLVELDLETGRSLWEHRADLPRWSIAISDSKIFIGSRTMNYGDQGTPSTNSTGRLEIRDLKSKSVLRTIPIAGNIKRIRPIEGNKILLTGNGNLGVCVMDAETGESLSSWNDFLLNTCEDAVIQKNHIHAITYGFQINSYSLSGETLASQFIVDNFPKVIQCVEGREMDFLVVAGRMGYISVYSIAEGIPSHRASMYISDR